MNTLEAIALDKVAGQVAKGLTIAPGEYKVDTTLTVRIVGTMKKGEDYDSTPTVSIPLKQALALALHYAGCTREAAKAVLIKAMTAALNGEDAKITDALPDVEAAMKHVEEVTAALPKVTKAGPLTHRLVMLVGEEQKPFENPNKMTDPRSKKKVAEVVSV